MTAGPAPTEKTEPQARRAAPVRALVGCVRLYQTWISPLSPPRCRFYPSCSSYAVTAIERHGALRGTMLAARRLSRCHPWNPGGIDDVPAARPSAGAHG